MPGSEPLAPSMRRILAATAVMNIAGAPAFSPLGQDLCAAFGIPDAHPLWLWTVGIWIFLFGAGYAVMAASARADRTFLGVAAAGKLSFGGLLAWMAATGELPMAAALAGLPDLLFAFLFIRWLLVTR